MNSSMINESSTTATLRGNAGVAEALGRGYAAGFVTDIEMTGLPPGLSEETVRQISAIKQEPAWMTEWRLEAYRHWLTMPKPDWAKLNIDPIDYQAISYYAAPKAGPKSLAEVDPALAGNLREAGHPAARARRAGRCGGGCGVRLGLGRHHLPQAAGRGRRAVLLDERGDPRIPELVQKYLGSVVPTGDNFFAR
jgi:ABC-type transport system involved in Fe-S cluster assembly, permease component